jgi:tRNA-dihydrouridine synthase 3
MSEGIGTFHQLKDLILLKSEHMHLFGNSSKLCFRLRFVNYGLEHWGSDTSGVETTRRFLLEWLSFQHRYIPVGLLQEPPQRINQRPPPYKGRDDLVGFSSMR